MIFFGEIDVRVKCIGGCGDSELVVVECDDQGSDYEELKGMAFTDAGFTDDGACCVCKLSLAEEARGEIAMRDRKAATEGTGE